MKKTLSLFALMMVATFAQVALAGPGCGGHGKHGPMKNAGIAIENTKDGVKVIVTAADPADVQALQDHAVAMKAAREKGECLCGHHGKEGKDGKEGCGCGKAAKDGKGCGCGDAKCDCEKGKCDCAKDGKGCGCGCDKAAKDGKDGKGCGCGDGKCDCEKGKCDCAKDGKGCGCGCDKAAKDGKGCGCGDKDGKGCGMGAKDGKGCGCPLALCALEGVSYLLENTIDGVIINVAGPDPVKIQKHFEGKARPKADKPAEKKGGCGCGGK